MRTYIPIQKSCQPSRIRLHAMCLFFVIVHAIQQTTSVMFFSVARREMFGFDIKRLMVELISP